MAAALGAVGEAGPLLLLPLAMAELVCRLQKGGLGTCRWGEGPFTEQALALRQLHPEPSHLVPVSKVKPVCSPWACHSRDTGS